MSDEAISAYALINARLLPHDRGRLYEDPLGEALAKKGYAAVVGAGTMQSREGEVEYCGIDLDVFDLDAAVPFVCDFLASRGAPRGSQLEYELDGESHEVPFGLLEGLAIYFDGTGLPDEVYETCDINHVYQEIDRLLGERGGVQSHWSGPVDTALYVYGYAVDEMKERIAPLMGSYPLCAGARYETIA